MPLFECETCGVVENTALGSYWSVKAPDKVECSECDTGKWHGQFPKSQASDGWQPDPRGLHGDGKQPFLIKIKKEGS